MMIFLLISIIATLGLFSAWIGSRYYALGLSQTNQLIAGMYGGFGVGCFVVCGIILHGAI